MIFKWVMYLLAVFFAFMTLTWAAGAADMTGLSTLVVVTWWSIAGAFGALALGCWFLGKLIRPRRGNEKEHH